MSMRTVRCSWSGVQNPLPLHPFGPFAHRPGVAPIEPIILPGHGRPAAPVSRRGLPRAGPKQPLNRQVKAECKEKVRLCQGGEFSWGAAASSRVVLMGQMGPIRPIGPICPIGLIGPMRPMARTNGRHRCREEASAESAASNLAVHNWYSCTRILHKRACIPGRRAAGSSSDQTTSNTHSTSASRARASRSRNIGSWSTSLLHVRTGGRTS